MNLHTIAEMTIEAFYKDENVFYIVADALRSVGDWTNAERFHNGKWTDQDRIEAICIYHADLIETMQTTYGKKLYEAILEARKYPYLIEYLSNQKWIGFLMNLKTELSENRFLGKAARAVFLLFRSSFPDEHEQMTWLISRYQYCVTLGLWREAAKWRKLGRGNWQWQSQAA